MRAGDRRSGMLKDMQSEAGMRAKHREMAGREIGCAIAQCVQGKTPGLIATALILPALSAIVLCLVLRAVLHKQLKDAHDDIGDERKQKKHQQRPGDGLQ